MKTIQYTMIDEFGLHARPAGEIVRQAANFRCTIIVECNGKTASANSITQLMMLGVKKGDTLIITFSGEDEKQAAAVFDIYFKTIQ